MDGMYGNRQNNNEGQFMREGAGQRAVDAALGTTPQTVTRAWSQASNYPNYISNQQVHPINCNKAMNITTFSDLQHYASGVVVRFPDFAEGQPFVARVRRPSMLSLAEQGKIPNQLLVTAGALFAEGGKGMDPDNTEMLRDVYNVCKVICAATLIEPTFEEIASAGMELSDDQLMAIFNYTQSGIRALESFREEQKDSECAGNVEGVKL